MRLSVGLRFAGVVLALGAAGCAQNNPPPIAASDIAPAGRYPLGAGDKLRITVYNEPNLTGEYNVTTSGTVAFPLIGTVAAVGNTIEEVTWAITTRLAQGYVNDPRVSVEVLNYRPYYILGEVARPGEFAFVSGMTVEQAVAAAGGFTYRANRKKLFLRRARTPEERTVIVREQPVQVRPGDTIRVGERYF